MTPSQKAYFDNMDPYQTIYINQVRNPAELIKAGKEYIDQGGNLTFNTEYTKITKNGPIPPIILKPLFP